MAFSDKINDAIDYWSVERSVDRKLIEAIIMVESGGNNYAVRFEPGFRWLVQPAQFASAIGITHETEELCQKMSWGVMQVMGGLARDLGYQGHIPALTDPELNINYATLYIKRLQRRWTSEAEVIAAYNAGSPRKRPSGMFENQRYIDKVYSYLNEARRLK